MRRNAGLPSKKTMLCTLSLLLVLAVFAGGSFAALAEAEEPPAAPAQEETEPAPAAEDASTDDGGGNVPEDNGPQPEPESEPTSGEDTGQTGGGTEENSGSQTDSTDDSSALAEGPQSAPESESGADAQSASSGASSSGSASAAGSKPGSSSNSNSTEGEGDEPEKDIPDTDEFLEAEEDEDLLEAQSTILDASTIIVYTFDELKTALSANNGFTTVYIGADITGKAGGIAIDASKPGVVIDGCPPGSPAGTRYTYTDYNSGGSGDVINLSNAVTKNVTVQNLVVNGNNFYGIICCTASGVTITYNNISYTGAQPGYNPGGSTILSNSDFTLRQIGGCAAQELVEGKYLEFSGTVTVNSAAAGSAVYWQYSGGTGITVKSGANVTITAANYFIYNDSASAGVTVEPGASLSVTTGTNGFTYGSMSVNSLNVGAGAFFAMRQNGASGNGAVRVSQTLSVGAGAAMDVVANGSGAGILLTGAGANASFSSPGRVRVYAPSGNALGFSSGGTLSINAGTVNLWSAAGSINETAAPTNFWNRAGGNPVNITAVYLGALLSTVTHNLALGVDPVSVLPVVGNCNPSSAKLITIGSMPVLSIGTVLTNSTALTGTAQGSIGLKATYYTPDNLLVPKTVTGAAGGGGGYSLALSAGVPALGTAVIVTMTSSASQLYAGQITFVLDAVLFSLRFESVPKAVGYTGVPISMNPAPAAPDVPISIVVADGRPILSQWTLRLRCDAPLQAPVGSGVDVLPGALVFVDGNSAVTQLSAADMTVYTHESLLGGNTMVNWPQGTGVMVQLPPGAGRAGAQYSATLDWTLADAP